MNVTTSANVDIATSAAQRTTKTEEPHETMQSLLSEIIQWQAKTALMKRRKRYFFGNYLFFSLVAIDHLCINYVLKVAAGRIVFCYP